MPHTRRELLQRTAALPTLGFGRWWGADLPPIRALTRAPGHHWFGYYDKLQTSPDDRLVLGMRVDFEHRTPRADDRIEVGMVDRSDADRWLSLGTSRAWGWQQGCMLQFVPGSGSRVLWNDREDGSFVCRRLDLDTREIETLPHAIYSSAPDGRWAVTADFARIQALRPGYGYVEIPDPHAEELAPSGTGVFRVDLESGERELLISLATLAATEPLTPDMEGAKHYVNHLLVSPDGKRFLFLHRWRPDGGRAGFRTRMFSAAPDGSDLHLLDPSGHTSHFIWRDAEHVAAWTRPAGEPRGFYLFKDRTDESERLLPDVLTQDGHITYLSGAEWVLCDTYPDREKREQHPFLVHVETERKFALAHLHSPPEYRGEWRCDTHPRATRDGRTVIVDSPHKGDGRQMWAIDVAAIVGEEGRSPR